MSSHAIPALLKRDVRSISERSPVNWAYASCWREAFGSRAPASASLRSSLTEFPAITFGQIVTTAITLLSSICRTRSFAISLHRLNTRSGSRWCAEMSGAPNPAISPLRAAGWHIAECTHVGNRTAIACAARALETNPKSVAAYQYLANAYIIELMTGWTENEADAGNLLEAARRATSLSPGDHLSQGLYAVGLAFVGNHNEALAYARRALALNSNSTNVLGPCGNVLSFFGEAREANEMLERMLRLAPAHYFRAVLLSQMALNWLCLGDPERGSPLASEALKLKPEAICCHIITCQNLGLAWPSRSRQGRNFRRLSMSARSKQSTHQCHVSASRQVHS